jgi:hypothetical protein
MSNPSFSLSNEMKLMDNVGLPIDSNFIQKDIKISNLSPCSPISNSSTACKSIPLLILIFLIINFSKWKHSSSKKKKQN